MLVKMIVKKILKAKLIKDPIDHLVIDNFLQKNLAKKLSLEFGDYNSSHWHCYSNKIEEKKTFNQWNFFKPNTYRFLFQYYLMRLMKLFQKNLRSR
jgi:hypothetical protein